MSTSANYAATPKIGSGMTLTADASTTAPSNTTVGVVYADTSTTGSRVDNLDSICLGTSVAGLLRVFLCEGTPGATIASITSSTTTATATTSGNHNLVTGDLVTIRGAYPVEYNVSSVAVTVTGATTFTFTIVSTANVAASTLGSYSATRAAAIYHLLWEEPIFAIVGSNTVPSWKSNKNTVVNHELFPIVVPPGWSVRTTVSVTQTTAIKSIARGGAF